MTRWIVCAALAAGCGGGGGDSAPDAAIGTDQTVTVFDGAHVYFGAENLRSIDVTVDLPDAALAFEQMLLDFALRCPEGGCDWWDRLGWVSVIRDAGSEAETEIEILRFITPYRVGGSWQIDATDLRPLLAGHVTLRIFIDTWVGPGHANGAGWLVDLGVAFTGGVPARPVAAVVPIWAPQERVIGDPEVPAGLTRDVELPVAGGNGSLRTLVTGHGQGNADNCAEFCALEHRLAIGDGQRAQTVWRNDCTETAVPGQQGTWQYARAGWCPGATVEPWREGVDAALLGAGSLTVGWDVASYENTCRPDAATCAGCTLGTGCEYDGGAHTPPRFQLSALLVLYAAP